MVDDLLEQSVSYGVSKICVSPLISSAREEYEGLNDFTSYVVRDNPCFEGFAVVHPFQKYAKGELERAIYDLELKGLFLDPELQGFRFSDDRFWDFLEFVKTLKIPVFVHCEYNSENKFFVPEEVNEVIISFPRVNFIFPQAVGWDKVYSEENVFYDTSHSSSDKLLEMVTELGADKVLFGSDFKYNFYPAYEIEKIQGLDLSEEEKEKILGGNMAQLFGVSVEKGTRFSGFFKRFFR